MSLSTQPSGRVMTPKGHDVMGRRHTHHHHKAKMVKEKILSITGHQRNENIADAVAKGANQAEERLRKMRLESGVEDMVDHSDTEFAMPRPSYKYGCQLKSQWMDPENNPIPPSKTYTEYQQKLRSMNLPHISYDIDGDGIVGPEDLFMAKRFDIDGNGVLDEEEQHIGKQIIAEQFFKAREAEGDLDLYGGDYAEKSISENIEELASAPGSQFKKKIQELKNIEQGLATISSKKMKDALTVWNPELIKHNYFTDKFDVTAWNDFGAPGPRDPNFHLQNDHKGSLDTFHNLRKNKDRFICQARLDQAEKRLFKAEPWRTNSFYGSNKGDTQSVAKTSYLSNTRIENTPRRGEVEITPRMYSTRKY
ncbi:hypothetical protein TrVE_jg13001 [Triparma verrucosa]|uniref:EF-hand domain-containing protein n=1 Tax=Triparma verrucosa TaxID=1606542 RepID=A0A9W7B8A9_9STRA|nr:hypothetical protein TrVE_jg13001 [Triparma verrucosa]